ncbi:MAG TPA: phosphomannomutase/phosphoglucomutase [archaeon]|nr:phosphomannomutase/phosphoglucomutase [archaeon]
MNDISHIFRAYDIRGIYGKDLTDEVAYKIGFVVGSKEKFVVGNDIRASSPALAKALMAGLKAKAAEIIYVGEASYGQTLFAGKLFSAEKTIFITASHLPPEWNGVKPYHGDGIAFSESELKSLRDKVLEMEEAKFSPAEEKIQDVKKEYSDFLFRTFKIPRKLKIVLDCGNGATCLSAPEIFKRFGHEVIEMFCAPDARFPNRPSEPSPENISALRKKVLETGADMGIAFDGDGDRSAVVDGTGRVLTGNETGVMIGCDILKNNGGAKVIKTVSCSMAIDTEFAPHSAKIITTPVGHTFVGEAVKREGAVIGIEESGHVFIPEYAYYDDALFVPLKIMEILSSSKRKLSEIADEHPIYPFEEIVFKCVDSEKFKIIDRFKEKLSKKYLDTNTLDGVKVNFDDGWTLVRAANTSPKIRLYVEALSQKRFEDLKKEFLGYLEEEGLHL